MRRICSGFFGAFSEVFLQIILELVFFRSNSDCFADYFCVDDFPDSPLELAGVVFRIDDLDDFFGGNFPICFFLNYRIHINKLP